MMGMMQVSRLTPDSCVATVDTTLSQHSRLVVRPSSKANLIDDQQHETIC